LSNVGALRQRDNASYPAEDPNGYCPNHSTGVKLPKDFKVTPEHVD
jgi:hypothetical protein